MKGFRGVCVVASMLSLVVLNARQEVSVDTVISHSVASVGMSEDGHVLFGESGSDYDHMGLLIWSWSDGEKSNLGRGRLFDISADGSTIVGEYRHPAPRGYPHNYYGEAAVWRDGKLTLIGHLPGAEYLSSQALLVSGDGSVVVGASASDSGYELFRYADGNMTGLGMDGWPQGISFDGSKFIFATDSGLWLWSDGTISEFELPGDYVYGKFDMSCDGGVVIGTAEGESNSPAFRCENGQSMALALPDDTPDYFSGSPNCISGDGKVILGNTYTGMGIMGDYLIWRAVNNWKPVKLDALFECCGLELPADLSLVGINYDGTKILGRQFNGSSYQAVLIEVLDMFGQCQMIDGIADTGDWMGRVNAVHEPWVWCECTACWFHVPEPTAMAEQGWAYPQDQDTLLIVQVEGTNWGYSYALNKWMYLSPTGWVYMM